MAAVENLAPVSRLVKVFGFEKLDDVARISSAPRIDPGRDRYRYDNWSFGTAIGNLHQRPQPQVLGLGQSRKPRATIARFSPVSFMMSAMVPSRLSSKNHRSDLPFPAREKRVRQLEGDADPGQVLVRVLAAGLVRVTTARAAGCPAWGLEIWYRYYKSARCFCAHSRGSKLRMPQSTLMAT